MQKLVQKVTLSLEIMMKRNESSISCFTLEMMVEDVMGRRVGTLISPVQSINKDRFSCVMKLKSHNLSKGKYYLNFNVGLKQNNDALFVDYDIVYKVLSFQIAYHTQSKKEPIKLWREDWGFCQFTNGEIEVK